MATPGRWYFRFKGSIYDTIYEVTVNGCSNDVPGIAKVASGNCYDGYRYDIVATARNNARYASDSSASTCGSGSLSIIQATFTADASVTGITCTADSPKYDCINGTCTTATTYNTPGQYQSLSACQAVCANGGACGAGKQCVDPTTFCPDGKVCLDQGEVNTINTLLAKISSEACH